MQYSSPRRRPAEPSSAYKAGEYLNLQQFDTEYPMWYQYFEIIFTRNTYLDSTFISIKNDIESIR